MSLSCVLSCTWSNLSLTYPVPLPAPYPNLSPYLRCTLLYYGCWGTWPPPPRASPHPLHMVPSTSPPLRIWRGYRRATLHLGGTTSTLPLLCPSSSLPIFDILYVIMVDNFKLYTPVQHLPPSRSLSLLNYYLLLLTTLSLLSAYTSSLLQSLQQVVGKCYQ